MRMGRYSWSGIDGSGHRVSGHYLAKNKFQLRQILIKKNIYPIKINLSLGSIFSCGKSLGIRHVSYFMEQFAILIGANVNITKALDIILHGIKNRKLAFVVSSCRESIGQGKSCYLAMKELPDYFDDFICNLVNVGEETGALDVMLHELASHLKKIGKRRSQLLKASLYPLAVFTVGILVCFLFFAFIIPQFEHMFANFGSPLPGYTRSIIALGYGIKKWGGVVFLALIGLGYAMKIFCGCSSGACLFVDEILLKLPVVRKIVQYTILARFMGTMSLMLRAGITIPKALEILNNTLGNRRYELLLEEMRLALVQGISMSNFLKNCPSLFPYQTVQLITLGEETGSLDKQLEKMAAIYDEKLTTILDNLHTLFEPIVMLVLGTIVGGLAVGIYLPIFRLGVII